MKTSLGIFISLIFIIVTTSTFALNIPIHGELAKQIFNSLTRVEIEGAAGTQYREGKSIVCTYTSGAIDDKTPADSPSLYACAINLDHDGLATPGIPRS